MSNLRVMVSEEDVMMSARGVSDPISSLLLSSISVRSRNSWMPEVPKSSKALKLMLPSLLWA